MVAFCSPALFDPCIFSLQISPLAPIYFVTFFLSLALSLAAPRVKQMADCSQSTPAVVYLNTPEVPNKGAPDEIRARRHAEILLSRR
jgi:hypothetical protein